MQLYPNNMYLTAIATVQALEAKAKLDSILKGCGNTTAVKSNSSANVTPDGKTINGQINSSKRSSGPTLSTAAPLNSASYKRPAAATQRNPNPSVPGGHGNKRRKQFGPGDGAIDPMDPTGTGGKWSEGLDHA